MLEDNADNVKNNQIASFQQPARHAWMTEVKRISTPFNSEDFSVNEEDFDDCIGICEWMPNRLPSREEMLSSVIQQKYEMKTRFNFSPVALEICIDVEDIPSVEDENVTRDRRTIKGQSNKINKDFKVNVSQPVEPLGRAEKCRHRQERPKTATGKRRRHCQAHRFEEGRSVNTTSPSSGSKRMGIMGWRGVLEKVKDLALSKHPLQESSVITATDTEDKRERPVWKKCQQQNQNHEKANDRNDMGHEYEMAVIGVSSIGN